jgi:hypothetical protein
MPLALRARAYKSAEHRLKINGNRERAAATRALGTRGAVERRPVVASADARAKLATSRPGMSTALGRRG